MDYRCIVSATLIIVSWVILYWRYRVVLTIVEVEREAVRIADDRMKHWRTRAQSAEAALRGIRHIIFPLADDEVRP